MHITCQLPNKTKGFSLIELMVSMVIGLTVLGGLMSMYLGSRQSDNTRTELSDLDANAVIALRELRKTIQHAGYATVGVEPLRKVFFTNSDGTMENPLCKDGKKLIVSGDPGEGGNSGLLNPPDELQGYTKDNNGGDVITVIYRPDSPFKGNLFYDCATSIGNPEKYPDTKPTTNDVNNYPDNYPYGSNNSTKDQDNARLEACSTDTNAKVNNGMLDPKDAKVYSAFFLMSHGNSKQLVCYGSRSRSADPYVIADNIENIQYRYAVRIGNNVIYKKADDIDDSEWPSIVSVQIGILVASNKTDLLENPTVRKYNVLDKEITVPATDTRMYKVYSTTVYLHNVGMN